ncbi:MAG: hypothetical protein ACYYKD_04985 [Rhodospirillales bacterium]
MLELPKNLDREALAALMRDERYSNPAHPQHKAFRKMVSEGFRRLYGAGPAARDASGRMIDPDAA